MSVSTDFIMKIQIDPRALLLSATADSEAVPKAPAIKSAYDFGLTVQNSGRTGLGREDDEEYVIEKPVGHHRAETGMQYRARW